MNLEHGPLYRSHSGDSPIIRRAEDDIDDASGEVSLAGAFRWTYGRSRNETFRRRSLRQAAGVALLHLAYRWRQWTLACGWVVAGARNTSTVMPGFRWLGTLRTANFTR